MKTLLLAACFGLAATSAAAEVDDVARVAALIDRHIDERLAEVRVTTAPVADDAEFLRRVYLDVGGVIPPVSEVRQFLADESQDKRRQAVDRLLDGSRYVTHFSHVWQKTFFPDVPADPQMRFLFFGLEPWLRRKLIDDTSYAQMVREILTVPFNSLEVSRGIGPANLTSAPVAFYQAKQSNPADVAGAAARIFLGVRIECAQCHDHPFDRWKREQFWSFAAFFAGIRNPAVAIPGSRTSQAVDPNRREIMIPDSQVVVQANHLDGSSPNWQERVSPRVTLADWVTARENPYFARVAVNRMWAQLFGMGLVDPVDDFGAENPPSHPALLDDLAAEFAARDCDLKFLIRAITASRTYQRTSRKTDTRQDDPRLFARMAVKGLSAEQLCDSLAQAAGSFEPLNPESNLRVLRGDTTPRSELKQLFANESDTPIEQQTTILQALAMMNGQLVQQATGELGSTLTAVAEFPFLSSQERIETMFLATVSRPPRSEELERLIRYIDDGQPLRAKRAMADVFWALLNSAEFKLNH